MMLNIVNIIYFISSSLYSNGFNSEIYKDLVFQKKEEIIERK